MTAIGFTFKENIRIVHVLKNSNYHFSNAPLFISFLSNNGHFHALSQSVFVVFLLNKYWIQLLINRNQVTKNIPCIRIKKVIVIAFRFRNKTI